MCRTASRSTVLGMTTTVHSKHAPAPTNNGLARRSELPGEELFRRAQALAPIIAEYQEQTERERRLARPVYDAMREAGLFRTWMPKAFGGFEAGEEAAVRIVEEVSRHDASAGWNLAIGIETSAVWALFAEPTVRGLLEGDPDRTIAGSVNPAGATARPVSGGFSVSGRWPFVSGCLQASWFMAGAIVVDDRTDAAPEGPPDLRVFVMPIEDCEIIDTWHTTGLRGTGSNDVAAHDVFVPADRQFIPMGPSASKPLQPGPLYSTSLERIVGFPLAAVALGLARDAIDSFKTIAVAKKPHASSTTLDQQHTTQLRVGKAEAALRSGRSLLYAVAGDMDAALQAGRGVDDDLFASAMLALAQATACAAQAVDEILDAAGTASVFEGSRLERCSRDIRMVPRHFVVGPSNFEMVGQYLLGGPLQRRR
jgi:indole-3-acetate monooxygenase